MTERGLEKRAIDALPGPLFVFDAAGYMRYWNTHLERAWGYGRERIASMSPLDFFPAEERSRIREAVERVFAEGVAETEGEVEDAAGRRLPHRFAARRIDRMSDSLAVGLGVDIREQRRAEAALRASEQQFRAVFEQAALGIVIVGSDRRPTAVNPAFERIVGRPAAELESMTVDEFTHPDDAGLDLPWFRELQRGERSNYQLEKRYRTPAGETIHARTTVSRLHDPPNEGEPTSVIALVEDITEKHERESKLRQWANVFENTTEAILITDPENRIVDVNPAFTTITGYAAEEIRGQTPRVLKSGYHDQSFYERMWWSLQRDGVWQGEIWNRSKDGAVYPQTMTVNAVRDANGEVINYIAVITDVTQLRRSQQELEYLAHHDPLTGLANRVLLRDRLEHALSRQMRSPAGLAVVLLDLDRFKDVNDSLGHTTGDELLIAAATRLSAACRAQDTIARLGGDEFAVLAEDVSAEEEVARLASRLCRSLAEPIAVDGRELYVGASAGIAVPPRDGSDAETLVKNADTAMYRAKEESGSAYCFYAEEMGAVARERVRLEADLRRAIADEGLAVAYQPQFALATGQAIAVEALARWQHPEEGALSPGRFLPMAEESGLMSGIGSCVLRRACADAAAWRARGVAFGRVAVNLTAPELEEPALVDRIASILGETGLPGNCLELELTESAVVKTYRTAAANVAALRRMGVSLAVDDFGTGYSSLAYLKELDMQKLKLDRSFVRDLPGNERDAAIARAAIALGAALELEVVAEGVETAAERDFLAGAGCHAAQGYLYARPAPPERLPAVLGCS